MSACGEHSSEMMRSAAGFHRHNARRQPLDKSVEATMPIPEAKAKSTATSIILFFNLNGASRSVSPEGFPESAKRANQIRTASRAWHPLASTWDCVPFCEE
jgi:hypothetical protein